MAVNPFIHVNIGADEMEGGLFAVKLPVGQLVGVPILQKVLDESASSKKRDTIKFEFSFRSYSCFY